MNQQTAAPARIRPAIPVWRRAAFFLCGLLATLILGCPGGEDRPYSPQYGAEPQQKKIEYIFAVHPLHNPQKLHETYAPLVDYINARLGFPGVSLRLEASRSYAAFNARLAEGHFHFALPNPYQTILSQDHGYRIFGKMDNDEEFRGILLLRKDSPIRKVTDLKGKTVSYPAPTALAATMLPQMFLQENGVDVLRDIENLYAGSQESSILSVYLGTSAAAATWPLPWRTFQKERPEIARQLYVKWQTDTLPSNGLVVRRDVPEDVAAKVSALLFALQGSAEGQNILRRIPLSRFAPADNATYAPVHRFVERFKAMIRPLEDLHDQ